MLANRNGLVDQTLTIAPGVVMDRAIFSFQQSGEYEPISPYVGRIALTTVPERGALGLVALALVGAATRSRVQRSRQVA